MVYRDLLSNAFLSLSKWAKVILVVLVLSAVTTVEAFDYFPSASKFKFTASLFVASNQINQSDIIELCTYFQP